MIMVWIILFKIIFILRLSGKHPHSFINSSDRMFFSRKYPYCEKVRGLLLCDIHCVVGQLKNHTKLFLTLKQITIDSLITLMRELK